MKRRQRKQKLVAEINITPLTDVVMVLLLIFMITTPLISQTNISVNLPQAKSGEPFKGSRVVEANISISREGMVYFNGNLVTKKELRQQVRAAQVSNPDMNVIVRSDKFVRFQDIVNVLDVLTDLGVTKLNIAATTQE